MRGNNIDISLGYHICDKYSILMNWHNKKNVHIIFIQPKVLKILTVKLHYYSRKALQILLQISTKYVVFSSWGESTRGETTRGRNDLGRNAAGAKRLGGKLDLGRNDPDSL